MGVVYVNSMDVYLNRWFANYDDARRTREVHGGFLFPYQQHFFVTDAPAVRELGLDPEDPDWEKIGWDWVQPRDRAAWERLREKRLA